MGDSTRWNEQEKSIHQVILERFERTGIYLSSGRGGKKKAMELATRSYGTTAIAISSTDPRFPADSVLDDEDATFWISSGLYPQELILRFPQPVLVSRVRTLTTGIRRLTVEKTAAETAEQFEKVFDVELPNRGTRFQTEAHQVCQEIFESRSP